MRQIDLLLANKRDINMVEIIPWRPEDENKMREAFPQLLAKQRLQVVRDWTEAAQIFDT